MVIYEIYFLTSALNHFGVYFGHVVDNIGEDRSGCTYRTVQVPNANALILGNLCEYCHKSYISKN